MPVSDHSAFSSRSPFAEAWFVVSAWASRRAQALALVGAAATLALGCTPKIGDSCTVSTNCSATGDRLCDITQPGGYCTIFNCEPGTCPEDSQCINFGTSLSSIASVCTPGQGTSPYQRSFCMASCGSNSDCRAGYECRNLTGDSANPNALGAVLADVSGNGMVCVVPWHDAPADAMVDGGSSTEVCTGSDSTASSGGAANAGAGDAGAAGN